MRIGKKKFLGQLVKVTFDDHYTAKEPDDDDMECWALGKVVSITAKKIRLRHWHANGDADGSTNHEFIVIIKSTIKKIRILK